MTKSRNSFAAETVTLESAAFGLDQQYQQMLEKLEQDIVSGRPEQARVRLDVLLSLGHCRRTVQNATEMLNGGKVRPLYLCSAWFLRDCLKELTRSRKEAMLLVSGLNIGNVRTLDRHLGLQYSKQSQFFVSADGQSNRQALRELDENGQRLQAWFHSHPGSGPASTLPSAIDSSHQGDLEQGGYPAVGAIFARDGHVRFFSHNMEFEVAVLGKQVEQIDEKLFRLGGL